MRASQGWSARGPSQKGWEGGVPAGGSGARALRVWSAGPRGRPAGSVLPHRDLIASGRDRGPVPVHTAPARQGDPGLVQAENARVPKSSETFTRQSYLQGGETMRETLKSQNAAGVGPQGPGILTQCLLLARTPSLVCSKGFMMISEKKGSIVAAAIRLLFWNSNNWGHQVL